MLKASRSLSPPSYRFLLHKLVTCLPLEAAPKFHLGQKPATTAESTTYHRSLLMGDVVDLTFSDSDDDKQFTPPQPKAAAAAQEQEDQQQRKRIMEFARNKTAEATESKRLKSSSAPAAAQSAEDTHSDAAAGAAAAGEAGSSCNAAAAADASGVSGFSNADLRALHEARMRRQQQQMGSDQQQQQETQHDALDLQAGGGSTAQTAAAGISGSSPKQQPPAANHTNNAAAAAAPRATASAGGHGNSHNSSNKSISLLTYNVWFKEEVAVLERMMGLGAIIRDAGLPTFICLQEVTPLILEILSNMDWWQDYCCSPHPFDMTYFTLLLVKKAAVPGIGASAFKDQPFRNSVMARGLRSVSGNIGGHSFLVVTTHLESPIPPQNFYSRERQQQMTEALRGLDAAPYGNVLFAGDMNWEDKRDGAPPLPSNWCDAWTMLHPGHPGLTYDAKNNPMLPYKGLALRLDRVLCKLRDWRLACIQMVGTQPLPGIKYTHTFRNGGSKELPVLPSDHFGLLLQLEEI